MPVVQQRTGNSSRRPTFVPYRLDTPPRRQWNSPIVVVARGRQIRASIGGRTLKNLEPSDFNSPGTPTDPESSPTIRPSRALYRSRSVVEFVNQSDLVPTIDEAVAGCSPKLGVEDGEAQFHIRHDSRASQAGSVPTHEDYDFPDRTPITGIHIGSCVFRSVNPSEMPVQIFEVPMSFEEFIELRVKLDSSDGGLTATQFRSMVGECAGCERIMLIRSKDHHRCLGKHVLPKLVADDRLFFLLDSTAGGQGITRNQFQQLFMSCVLCNRVFTHSAASYHSHVDDNDTTFS